MDHEIKNITPMKQNNIRIYGMLALLAVAGASYLLAFDALQFKSGASVNVPSLFGYFVLISAFVERSIEMFLSAWRSQGADNLDRDLEKKQKAYQEALGKNINPETESLKKELEAAEDKRLDYRIDSRFMALWIGLVIGVIVSLVGVRLLGNILEQNPNNGLHGGFFVAVDVLLTGSILAGGSEAVNKIMKVYNNIMSATAEKVKNT